MNQELKQASADPCKVRCTRDIAKGDHAITVEIQFSQMNSNKYDFAKIRLRYGSEWFVICHSSISHIYVDDSLPKSVVMELGGREGRKQTIHALFRMTKHVEGRFRSLYLSCKLTDRYGRSPQYLQYELVTWEDRPRCSFVEDDQLPSFYLPWLGLVRPRVHFTKSPTEGFVTGARIEFFGTPQMFKLTRAYKFGQASEDFLYFYPEHLEEFLPWEKEQAFVAPVHDPRTGAPCTPLLQISCMKLFLPNAEYPIGELWLVGEYRTQNGLWCRVSDAILKFDCQGQLLPQNHYSYENSGET